jgi:hypothetical protein
MGWTITHKDPHESAADFLKRRCLTWSVPPEAHPAVVAAATGSSCIAFAVRFPAAFWERQSKPQKSFIPDDSDGSVTTALVFLISGGERGSRQYNFGYKDMDECCGPNAPVSASILRHLSPLDLEHGGDSGRWAQAWRDRCKACSAARSKRSTLTEGARVTLAEPLMFQGGFSAREFVATRIVHRGRRRLVFRDVATGAICRLSARHLEGATVESPAA